MTISLRLKPEEEKLIRNYAKSKNITVSELLRSSVMDRIEDEFDLKAFEKALGESKKDSKCYSHEEVKNLLEIG